MGSGCKGQWEDSEERNGGQAGEGCVLERLRDRREHQDPLPRVCLSFSLFDLSFHVFFHQLFLFFLEVIFYLFSQ